MADTILIDITKAVRDFVDHADMSLDDLSYDVANIVSCYPENAIHVVSTSDHEKLANRLFNSGACRSAEDAYVLADYAILELYPAISDEIVGLGYNQAGVVRVKLSMSNNGTRNLTCHAVMAVKNKE